MGISLLMAGYPALGVAALVVDGVALLLFSRLHRVQENPVRALERGEKPKALPQDQSPDFTMR